MKPEIKYGIIASVGVCLFVLLEYALGFHTTRLEIGEYSGYLSTIIPVVVFYLALKELRDTRYGGSLTIGQGLKAGGMMSLLSAVVITVFFQVYNKLINPGWMETAMEWQRNKLQQAGKGEAEIAAKMEGYQMMMSDTFQIVFQFLSTLILGTLIALILTLVLRRGRTVQQVKEGK